MRLSWTPAGFAEAHGWTYEVYSEHVRGELRFHWVVATGPKGEVENLSAGDGYSPTSTKRQAMAAAERHARNIAGTASPAR